MSLDDSKYRNKNTKVHKTPSSAAAAISALLFAVLSVD
jgi:hypothetical protein